MAAGEIIINWDDDDWNAPRRIEDQVYRLQHFNIQVTGYHSMLFTDGIRWYKYNGDKSSNLGTSLCFFKTWWSEHPFKPKQVGEDRSFIDEAIKRGRYKAVDAEELVVASIHAGNTSPRTLSGPCWKLLPHGFKLKGYRHV